jgi:hypothetical protein
MTHPPTDLKDSWLENELDRSPYLPLVVIDFRVYAHQVHSFTESVVDIVGGDEAKLRTVVRGLWAYRLNRGSRLLTGAGFHRRGDRRPQSSLRAGGYHGVLAPPRSAQAWNAGV